MPRKARHTTSTGIYHVMMRGINHQVIFEDEEDNRFFLDCLLRMGFINDDDGTPIAQGCTYYAYCLMGNHFHLLIREREETIAQTLKRIADAYVYYYNRKYRRSGHLFKERFRSEPVNDMDYFTTLLCYIHQNRRTKQAQSQARLSYALQGGGRRQSTPSRLASLPASRTMPTAVGMSTAGRYSLRRRFVTSRLYCAACRLKS